MKKLLIGLTLLTSIFSSMSTFAQSSEVYTGTDDQGFICQLHVHTNSKNKRTYTLQSEMIHKAGRFTKDIHIKTSMVDGVISKSTKHKLGSRLLGENLIKLEHNLEIELQDGKPLSSTLYTEGSIRELKYPLHQQQSGANLMENIKIKWKEFKTTFMQTFPFYYEPYQFNEVTTCVF